MMIYPCNPMSKYPINEEQVIAVRGFQLGHARPLYRPSAGAEIKTTLTFDCETELTPAQRLRVGAFLYRRDNQNTIGLFYDTSVLSSEEVFVVSDYCFAHGYDFINVLQFDHFLARIAQNEEAAIIGFNLPFDFSRIATQWHISNGKWRNGFTLDFSSSQVSLKVKHLSARKSLFQWSSKKLCRARIIDVMTLGAAMLGRSHSLKSLAQTLNTSSQKREAEHGLQLSNDYLDYLVADVLTTQECYEKLRDEYNSYGLSTPIDKIYSEASLGKAYLREFGIQPLSVTQPDFPSELLGIIMSSYYGGRSEVHIRRKKVPIVYTDFLSMYPTVNAKMKLWKFVIAKKIGWEDATEETISLLDSTQQISENVLQQDGLWELLTTLVKVLPDRDIFPVRCKYENSPSYTIGTNNITSDTALWYTLADCVASVLLTGKVPRVLKSIRFRPIGVQDNLKSVSLLGREDLTINPYEDDFYKKLIELRKESEEPAKHAIKIIANSTCYGIFVELVKERLDRQEKTQYFSYDEVGHDIKTYNEETPGAYFNPLLATFITGAARLLLAVSEHLGADKNITYAFCDTDSMGFIASNVSQRKVVAKIISFFETLSPYSFKGSILKMEKINDEKTPLYCYAVSAKRYVLFNVVNGKIVVRKASAHGLGFLKKPFGGGITETTAPEWINELWIEKLNPKREFKTRLPMMKAPAMSQLTLNTAFLYKQLKTYNQQCEPANQIRPFSFMSSYQSDNGVKPISPMTTADNDIESIFDTKTMKKVWRTQCKTYEEVLEMFAMHPERKFLGGDSYEGGELKRRHIIVKGVDVIGKESNHIDPEGFIYKFEPTMYEKGVQYIMLR